MKKFEINGEIKRLNETYRKKNVNKASIKMLGEERYVEGRQRKEIVNGK